MPRNFLLKFPNIIEVTNVKQQIPSQNVFLSFALKIIDGRLVKEQNIKPNDKNEW